jgi:hypothetical protein
VRPSPNPCALFAIATLALCFVAHEAGAQAPDLSEYAPLLNRAIAAHMAAYEAPPEAQAPLLEEAVARDDELIAWLEALLDSDAFNALDAPTRAALITGRGRAEYNRAAALLELGRCAEARARLRPVLEVAWPEEGLAAQLAALSDEAAACAPPATVTLVVTATPADAEVLVDGALVGPATAEHELAVGEHVVTVEADGYVSQERSVVAASGEILRLSVALEALASTSARQDASTEAERSDEVTLGGTAPPPERPGKPPRAHEWALWGIGLAGVATGVGLLLAASDIDSQIDDLLATRPHEVMTNESEERDLASQRRMLGYIAGGVGIAAAILGTVLYLTRDADEVRPAVTWEGGHGLGLGVEVRF